MNFDYSPKVAQMRERLLAFFDEHIYPNERRYFEEIEANRRAGNVWQPLQVIEELKPKARAAGLWNLFLPKSSRAPEGLSNLEYAPMCEIMGRVFWAPEVFNCSAPDTGNMETLERYASEALKDRWLEPLLRGEIRSAFLMTEPAVASSDATNIECRIERDGDDYVINGRKWWSSGAGDPRCAVYIVMGKTDPGAGRHEQQSMIERTEDFIRKNMAGQKTKQAQSRQKMLEKVDELPRPAGRARVMNLKLPEPERSGRIVLDVKDLGKSYGDLTVLDGISFRLQRGDKMGVIGVNGAGKSTLLRLIVGQEAWDRGDLRLGAGVEIGYFEQEQKSLRGPHSVLDEAWKVTPLVPENEIRTFLGGFLFSGEDVYKPLNALSGGERSRLALALIVRSRANFLVLDEPTNHLDIPSRAVFEAAVEQFEGTVLTVSHDRWFLDRTVNQILAIDNGHAVLSLGN